MYLFLFASIYYISFKIIIKTDHKRVQVQWNLYMKMAFLDI